MYLNNGEKTHGHISCMCIVKFNANANIYIYIKITNIGHVLNYKNVHNYA